MNIDSVGSVVALVCMGTSELDERLEFWIDGERFVCLIHAGRQAGKQASKRAIQPAPRRIYLNIQGEKKSERTEIIKHDKVRTQLMYA